MPTPEQLNNRANPTATTINIPGQGQAFKNGNNAADSSVYYYNQGKLYSVNLGDLGKQTYGQNIDSLGGAYNYRNGTTDAGIKALKENYGIDYNSLQSQNFNLSDLNTQYGGKGDVNTLKSLMATPAGAPTTQTVNGPGTGASVIAGTVAANQYDMNRTAPTMYDAQSANQGAGAQAQTTTGTSLGVPISAAQAQAPSATMGTPTLPNTIGSGGLTSTPPISYQAPTPTNTASNSITALQAQQLAAQTAPEGPQAQQESDLITRIKDLNTQDAGKAAYQNQQNAANGVDAAQATKNSLVAQQQQILNEHAAAQLATQQGQGVTTAIDSRQRAEETRQYAIQSLSVSSLIAAADGDLANAQLLANKAVAEKFDPIEADIATSMHNLALIKSDPKTTQEEQAIADQKLAIKQQLSDAVAQAKSDTAAIQKTAIAAASSGVDAVTLQQIQNAQTPQEAQALAAAAAPAPKLPTSASAFPTVALQPGSTGVDVSKLQKALGINQTGIYDQATTQAVTAIQLKLGVDNSSGPGYFGPKTMAALGVAAKASSSAATSSSSIATADVTALKNALNASKFSGGEADGKFADPNLYLTNYNHWIQSGGDAATFFKAFPPATYINPANTFLPPEIMKFVPQPKASTGIANPFQ